MYFTCCYSPSISTYCLHSHLFICLCQTKPLDFGKLISRHLFFIWNLFSSQIILTHDKFMSKPTMSFSLLSTFMIATCDYSPLRLILLKFSASFPLGLISIQSSSFGLFAFSYESVFSTSSSRTVVGGIAGNGKKFVYESAFITFATFGTVNYVFLLW